MRQVMTGQKRMEKKEKEQGNKQEGKPASAEANGEREELLILHVTTSEVETARPCTGTRVTPAVWETGQYLDGTAHSASPGIFKTNGGEKRS